MLKRAIVLAAGLGTRMKPLTDHTPKALITLGGKALLDHALDNLEAAGCERIVVNTHHFAAQIEAHLARRRATLAGEQRARATEVLVSHEPVLLESGGGIVNALPLLGDAPFLVVNADSVWFDAQPTAIAHLRAAFDPERMDALLLLEPRARNADYAGPGDFALTARGELTREGERAYVFHGLEALHPRVFAGRTTAAFSLRELWRAATRPDGSIARHHGLAHPHGRWLHVGTPAERDAAERVVAALRSAPLPR